MSDPIDMQVARAGQAEAQMLHSRVLGSVAVLVVRGAVVRGIGFAVTLVLARLLTPGDFGLLALGLAVQAVGVVVGDVGLGAELLRQPAKPTRRQREAIFGFQLVVLVVVAGTTTSLVGVHTRVGLVISVFAWALVLDSLRSPLLLTAERELRYDVVAASEIAQTAAYAIAAVSLVAAGAGVEGVLIAVLLRPLAGFVVLLLRDPHGMVPPRFHWAEFRVAAPFGLVYQAGAVAILLRDQSVVVLTTAIAGASVVGMWAIAVRILQLPFLFLEAVWRVSFPAVARLIAAGGDPRADIERALSALALVVALPLVSLGASAPALVPLVFGARWAPAAVVVSLAALGLLVSGPVSAAGAGYLYATGRPGAVACVQLGQLLVWLLLLPLALEQWGTATLGIGALASGWLEAVVLAHLLASGAGVAVWRCTWPPLVTGAVGGAIGRQLCVASDNEALVGVVVAIGTPLVVLGASALLRPRMVMDCAGMVHRAMRPGTA